MTEIKPSRLSTVTLSGGEIYKLGSHSFKYINISNRTEGEVWISDDKSMPESESIVISAGDAYNDLFIHECVFIKAEVTGNVSMEIRKG